MAGRQKGALRIAIEDFLDTFQFSKGLINLFREFGEDQEENIAAFYNSVLGDLPAGYVRDDILRVLTNAQARAGGQGGIPTAIGFATSLGTTAASSFLAPYLQLMNYKIQKKTQTARIDPAALVQLSYRNPGLYTQLKNDSVDLGYSGARFAAVQDLIKPLLQVVDMIPMVWRGIIPPDEFMRRAQLWGWNAGEVNQLWDSAQVIPGIGDLVSMAVREAWRDDVASKWGYDEDFPVEFAEWSEKQGMSVEWARRYWRAHWQLPGPNLGFSMYHRLRPGQSDHPFNRDDLAELLKISDYPVGYRERMIEVAYQPITRVDLRRLYRTGVISEDRVYQGYLDLGYNEIDARAMSDFAIQDAVDESKGLTRSTIISAYKKSVISRNDAALLLTTIGYGDDEAEFYLTVADYDIETEIQEESLDYIKYLYVNSELDAQQVTAELGQLNLPATQTNQLLQRWDIARRKKQKIPTDSNLEDFYRRNIISRDQMVDNLRRKGWTDERVGWIIERIDQRIQEDAAEHAADVQKEAARLEASDKSKKYQIKKAVYDVEIALRKLEIADLKVAINSTDNADLQKDYQNQILLQKSKIAELNVLKAAVKSDYYEK